MQQEYQGEERQRYGQVGPPRGGYNQRGYQQGFGRGGFNQINYQRYNQQVPRQFSGNNDNWTRGGYNNFARNPGRQQGWYAGNDRQNGPANNYNPNRTGYNGYNAYPRPMNQYTPRVQFPRDEQFNRSQLQQGQQGQGNQQSQQPRINNNTPEQATLVRFVEVNINGFKARALVDTGASVSLIASKFVTRDIRAVKYGTLRGVGGTVDALGTTRVTVQAGPVTIEALFYVVEEEVTKPYDLYIGVDILEDHNWTVDPGQGVMDVGGYTIPIWRSQERYLCPINGFYKVEEPSDGESELADDDFEEQSNYDFDFDEDICYDFYFDDVIGDDDADEWYTEEEEEVASQEPESSRNGYPEIEYHKEKDDGEESSAPQITIATATVEGPLTITEEEREKFTKDIQEEFANVFGDIEVVPSDKIRPFEIKLKEGAKPFRTKLYRLSPQFEPFLKKEIENLLAKRIIRPSTSEFNSPAWCVPKKGDNGTSTLRMVIDYRKLNEITEFENYPLPRIDEILDKLGDAKCFSVMDLVSGYHQVPIKDDDIYKTGFSVFGKHYEFVKLAFGLQTAAQSFQKLMNDCLDELVGTSCYVYLDDIIVYGRTRQEHDNNLKAVLTRLNEWKLKVKLSKCQFLTNEINFLGHRITPNGVGMMVEKINALNSLKVPNTTRRLRSFLGLANYYRRFIPDYAKIASPLYALLRKDTKFKWDEDCQNAFDTLIAGINEEAILAFPDYNKTFHLTTDASGKGIGAVLSQEDSAGRERPVSFISRKLNAAEEKFSVTEQEALAIVWAIEQFRHFLIGKEFVVFTDHRPLTWIKDQMWGNGRIYRWHSKLQEYSFTVKHKPGRENYVADELSRNFEDSLPEPETEDPPKENYEDIIAHIGNLFVTQQDDEEKEEAQDEENPGDEEDPEDSDDEELADRRQGKDTTRVTDEATIAEIIAEAHSGRWAGHRGCGATESAIRFYFSIPKLRPRVKEFIAKCEQCLPMAITTTCSKPNERIAYDIIGPFNYKVDNRLYGLTIQDDFSKFTKFCALENCTAKEVARALVEEWILCYGIPRELLSDNGANLTGRIQTEIAKYFGIARITTSLGHPQTNGAVEKTHQRLSEFIRATDTDLKEDASWPMRLKLASYAFNTTVHNSTGFSPHHLMFGTAPRLISAVHTNEPFATPSSYIRELQIIQNELWGRTRENLIKTKERQAERDQKTKPKRKIEEYRVGQKVLIKTETLKGKTNRTEPVWMGPFEVTEVGEHSLLIKKRRRLCRVNKGHTKPFIE